MKRNLLIYRDHLLHPSETFIKAQGEGLKRYKAYYLGSRRVSGHELPQERVVVFNNGTWPGLIREAIFKITGRDMFLVNRLQAAKPCLVHAHFGSDGVLALPVAQKLGIPLVVTIHGFDATVKDEFARRSFFSHRLYVLRRHVLQRRASLFIAVSDFIYNKLIEQGYPGDKIIRHYIGVDVDRFTADPAIRRGATVLFVGRLVENKGCAYLIRSMGRVQKVRPDVELVIIGDGPLRPELAKLAAQTLRRYSFLGVQPHEAVRLWMNRAKVLCVPSITIDTGDSEAFGMVFAEAASMGLPVVSFATGGIPEAVAHGETGFLAPEGKWGELADWLQILLADEMLWNKMSTKGQARARRLFNLARQTVQLEEIYDQVMEQSSENRPGVS